ncbi:MAG: carbohydrate-binding domain-containing protein [Bacteroidales bacterium]|nr:carbohydrate-binding domain-containing protein [Bacteroidales bacterium]
MKKILLLSVMLIGCASFLFAQEVLQIHHNGQVTYESPISEIDSISFAGTNALFGTEDGLESFSFADIDSVTFVVDTSMSGGDIYITYNGSSVTVINPLAASGVTITTDNGNVSVQAAAGIADINYHVSGTTTAGYLYITSDRRYNLYLEGVSITNPSGPAIYSVVDQKVHVYLSGANVLTDHASSTYKATFQSKGQLIFGGTGSLTVNGLAKNGIHSDDHIKINNGSITVASAVNDGLHCDYFIMQGGSLTVSASGDGIDGDEGYVLISGGTLNVTAAVADTKAIKCDSTLTINGGSVTIVCSANQSKGLKSAQDIVINGGTLNITASGSTVLESTTSGNNPSYCSAIAAGQNVTITDGDITLTLPTSNHGGKGISADGNVNISGGTLQITTAGAGAAYTVSGSTKDSYSSSCIKSDGATTITGGHITCSSSGSGGKGIRSDGAIVIGVEEAPDSNLVLNVSTSGERFTVTSGGGGWPGGAGGDYCNPKAIRSDAALTINSGIITVTCTQNNEGGEGIESKTILTINGGQIVVTSNGDDAINASSRLNITGGITYAASSNNDGIDCNGPMYISGGFTIAAASKSPEEAFDCDNYTFSITGGTIVGTAPSGMFSNPTASVCTQHSLKYTHAGNNYVQIIRNSDNAEILTFYVPSISGGGGGWPGGGGSSSSAILTFSSPEFTAGSYTLKYGGSVSGGTNFHNYYTGATYSGGSTKTFTVGSSFSITSVN